MSDLPMHGVEPTRLPEPPEAARDRLDAALGSAHPDAQLRSVVADHPTFLDGWARLAEHAIDDDPVVAYAFARTGYHRGLDQIRAAGWRGSGPVPWSHEPNRCFLRSVRALMAAAAAIGETAEAQRCRDFLLQLDPDDAQGVGQTAIG